MKRGEQNIEEFEHEPPVLEPPVQSPGSWSSGLKRDGQNIDDFKHDYHDPEGVISKLEEKVASRSLRARATGTRNHLVRMDTICRSV